jgi:hypothetical protein
MLFFSRQCLPQGRRMVPWERLQPSSRNRCQSVRGSRAIVSPSSPMRAVRPAKSGRATSLAKTRTALSIRHDSFGARASMVTKPEQRRAKGRDSASAMAYYF